MRRLRVPKWWASPDFADLSLTQFPLPNTKGVPKNPCRYSCIKIAKRGLVLILPTYLPQFHLYFTLNPHVYTQKRKIHVFKTQDY